MQGLTLRRYGAHSSSHDARDWRMKFGARHLTPVTPPPEVDNTRFCPPVIDQMALGCCTGAGSSRAGKFAMNVEGYPYPYTPSALDIYAKARLLEGTPLDQDAGAEVRSVFKVWNEQGVCPEDSNADWSWAFSASDNRWSQLPPQPAETDALLHKCVKYSRVDQNVNDIKLAILNGIPLVIGISVYSSFEGDMPASTGIVPTPLPAEELLGGHCMFVHSYGLKLENYAVVQNSWGVNWGDPDLPGHCHISIPDYLCNPDLCSDIWALELIA